MKSSDHVSDLNHETAKLFWNGRSQAVRLPRKFRFAGAQVAIHREGDRVILEPIPEKRWPKGYWSRLARLAQDAVLEAVPALHAGSPREEL